MNKTFYEIINEWMESKEMMNKRVTDITDKDITNFKNELIKNNII